MTSTISMASENLWCLLKEMGWEVLLNLYIHRSGLRQVGLAGTVWGFWRCLYTVFFFILLPNLYLDDKINTQIKRLEADPDATAPYDELRIFEDEGDDVSRWLFLSVYCYRLNNHCNFFFRYCRYQNTFFLGFLWSQLNLLMMLRLLVISTSRRWFFFLNDFHWQTALGQWYFYRRFSVVCL